MKPVMMQVRHDPKNGLYGDCVRACIASILEKPAEAVPHFGEDGPTPWIMHERIRRYLFHFGLTLVNIGMNPIDEGRTPQSAMGLFSGVCGNDDLYYMVGGLTDTGVAHLAIAYGDKVVHDPSGIEGLITAPMAEGHYVLYTLAYKGGLPPRRGRDGVRRVHPKSD